MSETPSSITTPRPRPLSPHLGIYRPQISSVLSILHRMTGMLVALGLAVLALWLWAAAYDRPLFDTLTTWGAAPVGLLLLFGWTGAVYYHLCNGIRHLFWDAGKGFSLPAMTRSGWLVIVAATVMTLLAWYPVWLERGASRQPTPELTENN